MPETGEATAVIDEPITFETKERMIGKKIKVISGNSSTVVGDIYTVTSVHYNREDRGAVKIDGITVNVDPNGRNGFEWYVQQYELVEDEAEPATVVIDDEAVFYTQADIDTLQAEIDRLRAVGETRNATIQRIDNEFQKSLEIISERMQQEATNRGWCGEFGRIIKEVNAELPSYELTGCEQDWIVSWVEVYEVRVPRSRTVTAVDAETAIDNCRDDDSQVDRYDIREAVDAGAYEYTETDDESFNAEVDD